MLAAGQSPGGVCLQCRPGPVSSGAIIVPGVVVPNAPSFDTTLTLAYDSERMLSLPHLAIIFVVALVVFGPEKLPELARTLGKYTADFRRMSNEFKGAFDSHMRDLEREAEERRRAAPVTNPAPVNTQSAPHPEAENSILRPSETPAPALGAAEPEIVTPAVTPASGIVPSADPRIPPAPQEDAAPPDIQDGNAQPEPLEHASEPAADAQHHAS
jgi:TatA/E family protein of Tat protein translocase